MKENRDYKGIFTNHPNNTAEPLKKEDLGSLTFTGYIERKRNGRNLLENVEQMNGGTITSKTKNVKDKILMKVTKKEAIENLDRLRSEEK